jgi:hypothetical protein
MRPVNTAVFTRASHAYSVEFTSALMASRSRIVSRAIKGNPMISA